MHTFDSGSRSDSPSCLLDPSTVNSTGKSSDFDMLSDWRGGLQQLVILRALLPRGQKPLDLVEMLKGALTRFPSTNRWLDKEQLPFRPKSGPKVKRKRSTAGTRPGCSPSADSYRLGLYVTTVLAAKVSKKGKPRVRAAAATLAEE
jgi:hypothetical protein